MQSAAHLLPGVYRKLAQKQADEEAVALSLWPVVVGEKVAAHARAVRLFGATLIVEADSQEWRMQLASLSKRILAQLAAAGGKPVVQKLEFRVVVGRASLPPGRAASATGLPPEEAAISDPHLRRIYRLSRVRAAAR